MSFRVSFCSCVFQSFSIAITSLWEERTNLSAFRTFVRFVLVWICRFPLSLGVWEGLRFVIVALPGLLSYLFLEKNNRTKNIIYDHDSRIRYRSPKFSYTCHKDVPTAFWRKVRSFQRKLCLHISIYFVLAAILDNGYRYAYQT